MANDLYKEVTDNIINALENVTDTWEVPWNRSGLGMPVNHDNKPYRGINILVLWQAKSNGGFKSDKWVTFKKSVQMKNVVRKGEKGTKIFFFKFFEKENAAGDITKFAATKHYTVFNRDQLTEPEIVEEVVQTEKERNDACDQFITDTKAVIRFGGERACYIPSQDVVELPVFEDFKKAEGYYSTAFHELAHWTGSKTRLDRDFSGRFGDEKYAMEELVAEITSAFICAQMGIKNNLQHPEYIKNWIKVLKNDSKAIVTAASNATKAADLLTGITFDKKSDEEETSVE
jgi:antirestriction protein ArdC